MCSTPVKLTNAGKAFIDAFAVLLKTNDFKSITVTDIVKRSGYSGSTFYKHFDGKEDLCLHFSRWELQHFLRFYRDIHIAVADETRVYDILRRAFELLYKHRDVCRLRLHPDFPRLNPQDVTPMYKTWFVERSSNVFAFETDLEREKFTYLSVFIFRNMIENTIRWWMAEDFATPPDEMARHIGRILMMK